MSANRKVSAGSVHDPAAGWKGWVKQELLVAPQRDFLASIVVFLVALPLCIGIAIASGVPVAAGLVTGIVGGLLVGFLAGSPLQVSGPAAGLMVIVYEIVHQHGLESLGLIVLLAGAMQFVAGIFRMGQWFRAVSPAVIKGMLSGIGLLILASQIHVMVDDQPKGSGLENLLTIPGAVKKGMALSSLGSPEERRIRTTQLRAFGTLHDDQIRIRERVGELNPEKVPAAKELARLADEQKAVLERLEQLAAELQAAGLLEGKDRRARKLRRAIRLARLKLTAALDDLQNNRAEKVRQSQREAVASLEQVLNRLKNHDWAAKIGLLAILLIVLWESFAPKKLKFIPAPLLAIVIVTALSAVLFLPVLYVEVPNNLLDDLHTPSWNVLQNISWDDALLSALVIALVASAATLLCATAVDQMHTGPRTNYDRELAAQGIGNMVCGFLGALPMTGVIVRSAANVHSGARTRLSAILHGVWLLLFVSSLAFLLRLIPTAALAAILVYTGYKLIGFKNIPQLWRYGYGEVVIYLSTVGLIVGMDLLTGILVGIALSGLKLLIVFSRLKTKLEISEDGQRAVLFLEGAATFIRLPKLAQELERVPRNAELHVDLQHLDYIDHACLDLLMNWGRQHESTGGKLIIDWDTLHTNFRREQNRTQHVSSFPPPGRTKPDKETAAEGESPSGQTDNPSRKVS